jgi:hypothetical protein
VASLKLPHPTTTRNAAFQKQFLVPKKERHKQLVPAPMAAKEIWFLRTAPTSNAVVPPAIGALGAAVLLVFVATV